MGKSSAWSCQDEPIPFEVHVQLRNKETCFLEDHFESTELHFRSQPIPEYRNWSSSIKVGFALITGGKYIMQW